MHSSNRTCIHLFIHSFNFHPSILLSTVSNYLSIDGWIISQSLTLHPSVDPLPILIIHPPYPFTQNILLPQYPPTYPSIVSTHLYPSTVSTHLSIYCIHPPLLIQYPPPILIHLLYPSMYLTLTYCSNVIETYFTENL